MTTILGDIPLVDAAVGPDATFAEAAALLAEAGVPIIAVVDRDRRVLGLFGTEEVLRGFLPRYVAELRHTAFARDDLGLLAQRAREVHDEPVARHAVEPVTVERETSALHLGEVFLHSRLPALPVLEAGRFVGIVERAAFAAALARRGAAP